VSVVGSVRRTASVLPLVAFAALFAAPGLGAESAGEPASGATTQAPGAAASAEKKSPVATPIDVERLLQQLGQRGAALDQREADLAARERSISELEAEVSRRLSELEALRTRIEERLASFRQENGDSVQRLVKIYAEMPPSQAAHLLESLEPGLATDVVRRMKQKQAAAVLALMSPTTALRISELVARPLANVTAAAGASSSQSGAPQ
jgi:flagellar motility protein MotE (MotC chaperone)